MKINNFLNCKIDVSKKVFTPRIETEFWVKKAIKEIKNRAHLRWAKVKKRAQLSSPLEVLDIFAGTGCLGIAILKNCPEICQKVDFVDVEDNALAQIKINLIKNKIPKEKYRIIKSNLFENLRGKKYDIIFANPPYVALQRIAEVDEEVLKKEPKIALFAGKEGMLYIGKFLKKAKSYLKENGRIYFEFDPKQKEKIKEILKRWGYGRFQFRKDQFKKYRWLKIKLSKEAIHR